MAEKDFTEEYLNVAMNQMQDLLKDPELLKKTLKPFMDMQKQFLEQASPNLLGNEEENVDENEGGGMSDMYTRMLEFFDMVEEKLEAINKRVKRLEVKTGILKPKMSSDSSGQ